MLVLALVAQAAFGVADPSQRFAAVPAPAAVSDPCGGRGPVGRWVKMSTEGAPVSIHDQSWLESAAAWSGGRMVVALRRDGKWNGTVFDPCRNTWAPLAETRTLTLDEPWPSDGHDRPFQPQSREGTYDAFGELSVWDRSRKVWVTVKSDRSPSPRVHYAVALAGRKLLVWGGWASKSAGVLGDGAVLDLSRKSWKKMSPAGAPSPRLWPTAVAWTGSRLLVWGGRHTTPGSRSVRILGDGAQYDPVADRWTPISSVNAPSPRTDATVAWTGRKLVVVGGTAEPGAPLGDSGIYDPATNTWTPLGAPPAEVELPRRNVGPLTRVMLAPDGRVVFLPNGLGQIAVLDADRATWSMLAAAELGKRSNFRAFLVGRRLIVWGGLTVVAEHLCPPHGAAPGQPICDPYTETAPHNDGWMFLLPERIP